MEAKFGGKAHLPHLYGPMVSDLKTVGKKSSLEWDLNDWRWDGDLLRATPLNSIPPDCGPRRQCVNLLNSSSSFSDEFERAERDLEKRRRAPAAAGDGDDDECLRLGAGGQAYRIAEGEVKSGKKSKVLPVTPGVVAGAGSNSGSSRAVCQVEDCRADLSGAKDYHKRHKVCDMHSKASKALVGSIMQRFCQQCSRFHVLQEFDEGKRSCRRRLAGHNRRRRKTHPDNVVNGGSLNDEKGSSYLLISLLRILSNMHTNSSDQMRDQDLLSHLLKNLASVAGTVDGRNISALLQGSQGSLNGGSPAETSQKPVTMIADGPEHCRPLGSAPKMDDPTNSQAPSSSVWNTVQARTSSGDTDCGAVQDLMGSVSTNPLRLMDGLKAKSVVEESTVGRIKYNNIDLNSIYDDSQDHLEDPGSSHYLGTSETASLDNPLFVQHNSHKSSPPQLSRNSDSTSTQTRSPSTSSGEAQSRTDRIVFKLFGKDPSDLPVDLRTQIFNWLSNSPTDIESYIRPGCIILTIYLHLEKYTWEELCSDLGSSLKKLLDATNDPFWSTGWVYCRVRNYVAFTYNGHLILDMPLPLKNSKNCRISSIKPVAVSLCERTQFVVKGFNLFRPSTRLLCALDGKYLVQETCHELMDNTETTIEHEEIQSLRFSCSVPSVTGRGFIEVEDHGLSSSFFPFIVVEQEVCSEICTLEGAIEVPDSINNAEKQPYVLEAKNQAMDFIHEMGWLLHRSRVKCRLGPMDPHSVLFPFRRFKWLMEFSMDRDWCSVVNKLLCILLEGCVDSGAFSSLEVAILDMGLLHRAVRRNCRPMVELLLKFVPRKSVNEPGSESDDKQQADKGICGFLFKPDIMGPSGLTPLHVAASQVGFESVLDALTDDPGKVGIEVWKNAKDETGLTPNDYASLRGHYAYINLVQRKTAAKAPAESGHVVVDIPGSALDFGGKQPRQPDGQRTSKVASLELDMFVARPAAAGRRCGACQHHHLKAGGLYSQRSSLVYRPAMLSMLAIAAVCVCVALLFKSSPEVLYVFQPFRWERLKYGSS